MPTLTLDELAKFAGVTKRTVMTWRKEGMPIIETKKRGKALQVDSAEVWEWWTNRQRDEGKKIRRDTSAPDWTSEKRRLEVEAMRGALLERDQVVLEWNELVATIRKMVLSIPNRCAGLVAKKTEIQAREILAAEVRSILREAVEYDEKR